MSYSDNQLAELDSMPFELLDPKFNKTDFLFKLIIIGDSAVGKSCLMQRVTTNEFLEDHEVTVGVEFGTLIIKLEESPFKLQIWDTAGQESFKSITKIFYRGAHCVCLCYDITRMDTFLNLETWLREVRVQSDSNVTVILIGNMKDREQLREVKREQAQEFCRKNNIAFFLETSAKTGENVQKVFLLASKILYRTNRDTISEMVSLLNYLSFFCYIERKATSNQINKPRKARLAPISVGRLLMLRT